MTRAILTDETLPPFLRLTEPLTDPDQIALQVALLTMELASIRTMLAALSGALAAAGTAAAMPELGDLGGGPHDG